MTSKNVTSIRIDLIDRNPHNPRGIDIALQDEHLPELKDSINMLGILVPLVVTPRGKRFTLIDGERRYVAAKSIPKIKEVPVYIAKKGLSDEDILLHMFHIHHTREQWNPTQQCKALDPLYKRIKKYVRITSIEDKGVRDKAIAEEIVKKTGLKSSNAENRVWFLSWPEKLKEDLYKKFKEKANFYICEIESKIIIPALRNFPEYFKKVPVDDVRIALYEKLNAKSIKSGTDVRLASVIASTEVTKSSDRKKVHRILTNLHKDRQMTYAEARDEYIREFPGVVKTVSCTPRKLYNSIDRLSNIIENFDVDNIKEYKGRSKVQSKQLAKVAEILTSNLKNLIDGISEE